MIERFLKFEEDHSLLERKVKHFLFWPYIRFDIYMKLTSIKNDWIFEDKVNSVKAYDLLCALLNCTIYHPLLHAKHKDILFFTHQRRVWDGREYRCIYTDDVADEFGNLCISAENLYNNGHLRPASTKRLLYLDYITIQAEVKSWLPRLMNRKCNSQLSELATWLDAIITEEFQVSLGQRYITELLVCKYYRHYFRKRAVTKLLKKIHPRVIVEVVGYDANRLILNESASELGITTIELQHGVINEEHIAYNYAKKSDYQFFPDRLFIWGEYFKNARYPISDENIIITGFPHFEKSIRQYPKKNAADSVRIIVLSQPGFSEMLLQQMIVLIDLLDNSGKSYSFVLKPHPDEYVFYTSSKWDMLNNYCNAILAPKEVSLYELLSESDIQISIYSTAIYEGLAYGLKTFLYNIDEKSAYTKTLVERRYARYFKDAAELAEIITDDEYFKCINESVFFAPSAKENIMREIRKYI